jgi:hypothetical protein
VAAEPIPESTCTCDTVRDQCLTSVVPFLDQSIADAKSMALDGAAPISADADLRKVGDLASYLLRLRASASLGSEVLTKAYVHAFLGRDLSACENDLQGATLANDAR